MIKLAIDVRPGDKYGGKTIIAVERLNGGIILKFSNNKQIYIQGLQSEVWIDG